MNNMKGMGVDYVITASKHKFVCDSLGIPGIHVTFVLYNCSLCVLSDLWGTDRVARSTF